MSYLLFVFPLSRIHFLFRFSSGFLVGLQVDVDVWNKQTKTTIFKVVQKRHNRETQNIFYIFFAQIYVFFGRTTRQI